MRKTICREGVEDLGILIMPDALTWADEVPLVWNFHNDPHSALGKATKLRREEDGRITAKIVFDYDRYPSAAYVAELTKQKLASYTIWANELTREMVKVGEGEERRQQQQIHKATIRMVSAVLSVGVPWT